MNGQGKTMSARIDSFHFKSASPAFARELSALAPTSSSTDIVHIALPDNVPDDALKCVLVLYYPKSAVLYLICVLANIALSAFGQLTLSTEREWALALVLAMRWELSSIRSLAMSALDSFLRVPVDRAVAGVVLGIQEWVAKGMADLAQEMKPMGLTVEDISGVLQRKRGELVANLGLGSRE